MDFDNTIVWGDIHEATLAVLCGAVDFTRGFTVFESSFRLPQGKRSLSGPGPISLVYYEALLAPTAHGSADPTPMANGYAWAVEILEGLTRWIIVRSTRRPMRTLGRWNHA